MSIDTAKVREHALRAAVDRVRATAEREIAEARLVQEWAGENNNGVILGSQQAREQAWKHALAALDGVGESSDSERCVWHKNAPTDFPPPYIHEWMRGGTVPTTQLIEELRAWAQWWCMNDPTPEVEEQDEFSDGETCQHGHTGPHNFASEDYSPLSPANLGRVCPGPDSETGEAQ